MFALVVCLVLPRLVPALLTKQSLAQVDPLAVCMDGSPAAYYWNPAVRTTNTWLVYLGWGKWCHDEKSCTIRCGPPNRINSNNTRCSSKALPETATFSGIFKPDDNRLKGINQVFVSYCTSDAHMGNTTAFGFQFRGHPVVQSVLRDLVDRRGLGSRGSGSKGRDLLIFGGGSAGARGAMVHLDYVQEMLGAAGAHVDVVGFLDSNFDIEVDRFRTSSLMAETEVTRDVHGFANVQHLRSGCAAQYEERDQWRCMYGQYRMPHVTTRYFMVAFLYDQLQLEHQLGKPPFSLEATAYAEQFALSTRAELDKLFSSESGNALFSCACYAHQTSTSHLGVDGTTCGGAKPITMENAFHTFLGDVRHHRRKAKVLSSSKNTSTAMTWIDTCDSFQCNPLCQSVSV